MNEATVQEAAHNDVRDLGNSRVEETVGGGVNKVKHDKRKSCGHGSKSGRGHPTDG